MRVQVMKTPAFYSSPFLLYATLIRAKQSLHGAMSFVNVFLLIMFVSCSYLCFSVKTAGYQQVEKETSKYHNVFYEEKKVCNRGRVLLQWKMKKCTVSKDFASAVCKLPEKYKYRGTVSVLNLVDFLSRL